MFPLSSGDRVAVPHRENVPSPPWSQRQRRSSSHPRWGQRRGSLTGGQTAVSRMNGIECGPILLLSAIRKVMGDCVGQDRSPHKLRCVSPAYVTPPPARLFSWFVAPGRCAVTLDSAPPGEAFSGHNERQSAPCASCALTAAFEPSAPRSGSHRAPEPAEEPSEPGCLSTAPAAAVAGVRSATSEARSADRTAAVAHSLHLLRVNRVSSRPCERSDLPRRVRTLVLQLNGGGQ